MLFITKPLFKNQIYVFQFLRIFVVFFCDNQRDRKKKQLKKLINFYIVNVKVL